MASQLELSQKPFIELEIEQLIRENRVQSRHVTKFIDDLEDRLVNIKSSEIKKLSNIKLRLPFVGRPNSIDSDYPKNFKFSPPSGINVIGGFRTLTAIKKTNHIDLAVCMPSECFNKTKDIKNQRYHLKRALYLSQLAFLLGGSTGRNLVEKLEYTYHQGDFLKPVLLIVPEAPKLKAITSFQLFVYPPEDVLKISSLVPSHGNVAPRWFFKDYPILEPDQKDLEEFLDGESDATETPFYNSSILFDLEIVSNSDLLFEQIGTHASIIEALVLCKIWLYQRELHKHFSFIISVYIAYLQTQQTIHRNMSSYQIFKVVIKSLTDSDWDRTGLCYFEDSVEKIPSFKKFFPVVFLSPSSQLNLCYNITVDLYRRLKHEAQLSQDILTANASEAFDLLFLKRVEFDNKFDALVHIPRITKKLPMRLGYLKKFIDHGAFVPKICSENILNLVTTALTDRVTLIQQTSRNYLLNNKWNPESPPYDPSNENHTFTLGLLLDPERSLRVIDIGPPAQTKEAEEFRQFWDPKCQLRLQNGIISETVVWHVQQFSQRREIIKFAIEHALEREDLRRVVVHNTLLERFISLKNIFFKWKDDSAYKAMENSNGGQKRKLDEESKPLGVGEEVFQKVLNAYNNLAKVVRNVEGLKHSITAVQPVSPHLRGSAVFPPLPVNLQMRNKSLKRHKGVSLFPSDFNEVGKILHLEPVEILLTLESTGKWPNEHEASEAAKLEYLIQLGEAMREKDFTVKFAEDYLDVLHGQFIFRLRVKCAKQLSMIATSHGKQEFQKKRLELEVLPRVHAALDQLYREKPAFGSTCRLVKRWTCCHLITDYISDTALELIVAHLFLHPQPYTEPSSSLCGFRRFLELIAHFDWTHTPLIVNFDNQIKLDEVARLKTTMSDDRSKLPPIVICTPYDKETSPWTKSEPSYPVLDLLIRLCTQGLQFLNKEILGDHVVTENCKALFRPNLQIFDLIINLHPQAVQNSFMSIDSPKNFKLSGREPLESRVSAFRVMPIVGLNVVEQFVELLRAEFYKIAMFCYDKYGQSVIGVLLKPDSGRLKGDVDKFVTKMKELGAKLVESIDVVRLAQLEEQK